MESSAGGEEDDADEGVPLPDLFLRRRGFGGDMESDDGPVPFPPVDDWEKSLSVGGITNRQFAKTCSMSMQK